MKRREFLHRSACTAGALALQASGFARRAFALSPLPRKFSASDTVTLGKTGIQTSRLAMGTGTVGSGHHSHQTALGPFLPRPGLATPPPPATISIASAANSAPITSTSASCIASRKAIGPIAIKV